MTREKFECSLLDSWILFKFFLLTRVDYEQFLFFFSSCSLITESGANQNILSYS